MLYTSYGSNMNKEQMKYRCPFTKPYGTGKLYGWKLVFNLHADIIETGNKDDFVPVVVWNLENKTDKEMLDRYEGYPSYYIKRNVNVVMDGTGEEVKTMVYVMSKRNRKARGGKLPSSSYFYGIVEGYDDFGIDNTPLINSLKECAKDHGYEI